MRVKYSLINISAGMGSQVIITLLSLFTRTVFIYYLGVEYLGINGLFTNILGMLSLVEAGIGSSIIYSLYKPVADNDQEKINMLMKLYRKLYMIIAAIIFLLGLMLMPLMEHFTKGVSVENIYLIYFIFLINTVVSYFFAHKISFLNVSQKNYIVTTTFTVSSIVIAFIKIGILYLTQNFILFLISETILTLTTSIILSTIVNKMYPFLKNKVTSKLDSETKNKIIKNVKAIVLHNIGGFCVFGTDNLIIASFVSVIAVGLYSNYYMVLNICRTFINQVFDNIYHSVGNLVAKESTEKIYSIFKIIWLFNFWIYSFFTIFLSIIFVPLITLWIGTEFLMGTGVLIILLINFFVSGMRRPISTVKTTSGIFHEDRYAPFFEAIINLVASIILVQYLGIAGVFIGTLISTLAVPFWTAPYLVYKKVFEQPVKKYFLKYAFYAAIGLVTYIITSLLCHFIIADSILKLLLRGLICFIIVNTIYTAVFYRTDEFKYLLGIGKSILAKIPKLYLYISRISRLVQRMTKLN